MITNTIFLSFASAFLTLLIIFFFLLKAKRSGLFYSFICYQAMIFLSALPAHEILSYLGIGARTIHFLACDGSLFLTYSFTGTSWLVFCLFFTGNSLSHNRKVFTLLFGYSLLCFLISMVFGYMLRYGIYPNYLFYNFSRYIFEYALWIKVINSCLFMSMGIGLLISHAIRKNGFARTQALLLSASMLVPLAIILIQAYFNRRHMYFIDGARVGLLSDLIHAGFAFSSIIIVLLTFRYKFMNIVPIALQKAIRSMREGMAVIDRFGGITYFNDSFRELFHECLWDQNETDIGTILEMLERDALKSGGNIDFIKKISNGLGSKIMGDISLDLGTVRYFSVNIEPFYLRNGKPLGSVITFNDITEYKTLLKKLGDYARISDELATARERNRLAREIHDSLGYSMVLLIATLEVGSHMLLKDPEGACKKIEEALDTARTGLTQVRQAVEGLSVNEAGQGLVERVEQLAEGFRRSGINVAVQVYGIEKDNLEVVINEALYRICQEALTNSMKHGRAKNVELMIRCSDDRIKLFIFDDGTGGSGLIKGFGLKGMERRVEELNGYISFGSGEGGGFNIHVEIPIGCGMLTDYPEKLQGE